MAEGHIERIRPDMEEDEFVRTPPLQLQKGKADKNQVGFFDGYSYTTEYENKSAAATSRYNESK